VKRAIATAIASALAGALVTAVVGTFTIASDMKARMAVLETKVEDLRSEVHDIRQQFPALHSSAGVRLP
jgi:hypothetical protein